MKTTDLFENNIIPFPTKKPAYKEPEEPRADINYDVVERLKELNQDSIQRQRDLALPTIMNGQPKGIKPVVAWAVALDEIAHIQKKNKIQQWIFDKGREIIDSLIKLNRQDLEDYKQLYQIKMQPWETGKTSAAIYKYKQVDRTAEDLLQQFKKEHVKKVSETSKITTISSATRHGKINTKLADKITDPHGYFASEGEVIPFKKKDNRVIKPSVDFVSQQTYIDDEIDRRLNELHTQSLKRQRDLALPTIMSGQPKGTKPVHAWALHIADLEWQDPNTWTTTQKWIHDKAKELLNRLIEEIQTDLAAYEDLYILADTAPAPQYPRQQIEFAQQEDASSLQILEDFADSV